VNSLRRLSRALFLGAVCFAGGASARAQFAWEYGGFVEQVAQAYARRPNPSDSHAISAGRLQLWTRATLGPRLSWRGSLDFGLDTHRNVDRRRWTDLSQQGLLQPAGSVTEFYVDAKLGKADLRLGKQEIRWGRADGFNPTDNLVPYNYLDTFSDQRIAVPALKADIYVKQARFEAAWIPFYTPTRLPLLNQRWFPRLPARTFIPVDGERVEAGLFYRDGRLALPPRTFGNGQWGARWNQLVPRAEFSISYFDGFDDIAFFRPEAAPLPELAQTPRLLVRLNREYHRVRIVGADFASGFGPLGIRGEMAYFDQTDPGNRDHLLFVLGLDRTWGDWFAIIQYAGQKVSQKLAGSAVFPDLGLRSTALLRIERNMGPSRSFEMKVALRLRDGDFMLQPFYNVALSNRWRLKVGATLFGGTREGFLGQYRDSSHLNLQLRYTF